MVSHITVNVKSVFLYAMTCAESSLKIIYKKENTFLFLHLMCTHTAETITLILSSLTYFLGSKNAILEINRLMGRGNKNTRFHFLHV